MHILIAIQDIRSLVENVIEELCHQESSSLVLLSRHVHLVLQVNVVALQQLILTLGSLKFLLDFLQLVFQEVD